MRTSPNYEAFFVVPKAKKGEFWFGEGTRVEAFAAFGNLMNISISRVVLATLFVLAGANHFRAPDSYLPLMPPILPFPRELILLSGAAEIVGGVLISFRQTRRFAGFWLLALLVAVFPANFHAALNGLEIGGKAVPAWLLWARLPLQIPLVWWVWHEARIK